MDRKSIDTLASIMIDSHQQKAEALAREYAALAERRAQRDWADIWEEVAERIALRFTAG